MLFLSPTQLRNLAARHDPWPVCTATKTTGDPPPIWGVCSDIPEHNLIQVYWDLFLCTAGCCIFFYKDIQKQIKLSATTRCSVEHQERLG